MQVADTPMEMIIGTKLLGTFESNREIINKITYSQLDWILGQNPVGVSFVSGYGDNSVKYPFSIMYRTDNLPGVPKGYLVGGPNKFSNDITVGNQISRFDGKNYTDNFQEWTTNEHTVYWNSGLVFVAAYATGNSSNSSIHPGTAAFDKNTASQADIPVTLTLNGNTFTGINNGTAPLVAGTDYTVSGTEVTIQKAYLAAQPVGTTTLTFSFSAGASVNLAVSVTDTTSGSSGTLKVQQYNSSTAATANTLNPRIKLVNTGTTAVNLADVKLRYYYTIDGEKDQSFWCDWSTAGSSNVTGTFAKLAAPVSGADSYLEIGFTSGAGSLAAGASIEIQIRVSKNDWSNYTQTGDYSFDPTDTAYVDWSRTTGYIAGTLQWGIEP
jgi:hypothetical protein